MGNEEGVRGVEGREWVSQGVKEEGGGGEW